MALALDGTQRRWQLPYQSQPSSLRRGSAYELVSDIGTRAVLVHDPAVRELVVQEKASRIRSGTSCPVVRLQNLPRYDNEPWRSSWLNIAKAW
jgi:hypothetical protein